LEAGQSVTVQELNDGGWWYVETEHDKQTGWFPADFLSPTSSTPQSQSKKINFRDPLPHLPLAQPKQASCKRCKRVFDGSFVTSSKGFRYHPECMCCVECGTSLIDAPFFEKDQDFYCKEHFDGKFAIRCSRCDRPIADKMVKVKGKQFHKDCFTCFHCDAPFKDGVMMEKDGKPYCKTHYVELFSEKCSKCLKGMNGDGFSIEQMGLSFHFKCFKCDGTNPPHAIAEGIPFSFEQNKLFCELHGNQ
jgi:hypothetical protein